MKRAGQLALVPFPYTDLSGTKLRPVLMLRRASRLYDDWLIAMVSSQLNRAEPGLDEVIHPGDQDFGASGLKAPSVVRLSRLAVVDGGLLMGCLGAIADERLTRLRHRLAAWLVETG